MAIATSSRVRPHPFERDESLADPYEQSRRTRLGLPLRQWCRCGLPGEPGDARHTRLTLEEVAEAWREWDAARLGERDV